MATLGGPHSLNYLPAPGRLPETTTGLENGTFWKEDRADKKLVCGEGQQSAAQHGSSPNFAVRTGQNRPEEESTGFLPVFQQHLTGRKGGRDHEQELQPTTSRVPQCHHSPAAALRLAGVQTRGRGAGCEQSEMRTHLLSCIHGPACGPEACGPGLQTQLHHTCSVEQKCSPAG